SEVAGQRQAREINFQEFGVAAAVRRRMEERVGVMENVFRADCLFEIAAIYRKPLQSEALGQVLNELGIEVCAPAAVRGRGFEEGHQHGASAALPGFFMAAVKI